MTDHSYNQDFHGWPVDDALQEIEGLIGQVRLAGNTLQAELITGNGEIKQEFFRIFNEYNLECSEQLGNTGVLMVTIL